MIKTIEIDGYRLLDGFKADLDPLTVVIGANSTGKSSLIECLKMISHSSEYLLKDVLGWNGGMDSILSAYDETKKLHWKLTFETPKDGLYQDRLFKHFKAKYYVYEVVIEKDRYGRGIPQFESLRTEKPQSQYTKPFIFLEATPYRSQIFDLSKNKLVPFDDAVGGYPKQPDDDDSEILQREITLRLSQMRFVNEYPVPSLVRALFSQFGFYPGFDVRRQSELRTKPSDIKPETVLHPNGENLGTVLHEVFTRASFRQNANELRKFFCTAYPYVDDIFPETAHVAPPKVVVRIREKGLQRSMELWDLSDGMLRFLCLSAALLAPAPVPFVAIDEPEAGLHPKLLPIVADMIKTAAQNKQVLVTTHSPDLLNCFDIDHVAVMSREENKIVWQRPRERESLKTMLATVTEDTLGDLHRSGELEVL